MKTGYVVMLSVCISCLLKELRGLNLRKQVPWKTANFTCADEGGSLYPGRGYKLSLLKSELPKRENFWMNGFRRRVILDETDRSDRFYLKVDYVPTRWRTSYFCQNDRGNIFWSGTSSDTAQTYEGAAADCALKGAELLTVRASNYQQLAIIPEKEMFWIKDFEGDSEAKCLTFETKKYKYDYKPCKFPIKYACLESSNLEFKPVLIRRQEKTAGSQQSTTSRYSSFLTSTRPTSYFTSMLGSKASSSFQTRTTQRPTANTTAPIITGINASSSIPPSSIQNSNTTSMIIGISASSSVPPSSIPSYTAITIPEMTSVYVSLSSDKVTESHFDEQSSAAAASMATETKGLSTVESSDLQFPIIASSTVVKRRSETLFSLSGLFMMSSAAVSTDYSVLREITPSASKSMTYETRTAEPPATPLVEISVSTTDSHHISTSSISALDTSTVNYHSTSKILTSPLSSPDVSSVFVSKNIEPTLTYSLEASSVILETSGRLELSADVISLMNLVQSPVSSTTTTSNMWLPFSSSAGQSPSLSTLIEGASKAVSAISTVKLLPTSEDSPMAVSSLSTVKPLHIAEDSLMSVPSLSIVKLLTTSDTSTDRLIIPTKSSAFATLTTSAISSDAVLPPAALTYSIQSSSSSTGLQSKSDIVSIQSTDVAWTMLSTVPSSKSTQLKSISDVMPTKSTKDVMSQSALDLSRSESYLPTSASLKDVLTTTGVSIDRESNTQVPFKSETVTSETQQRSSVPQLEPTPSGTSLPLSSTPSPSRSKPSRTKPSRTKPSSTETLDSSSQLETKTLSYTETDITRTSSMPFGVVEISSVWTESLVKPTSVYDSSLSIVYSESFFPPSDSKDFVSVVTPTSVQNISGTSTKLTSEESKVYFIPVTTPHEVLETRVLQMSSVPVSRSTTGFTSQHVTSMFYIGLESGNTSSVSINGTVAMSGEVPGRSANITDNMDFIAIVPTIVSEAGISTTVVVTSSYPQPDSVDTTTVRTGTPKENDTALPDQAVNQGTDELLRWGLIAGGIAIAIAVVVLILIMVFVRRVCKNRATKSFSLRSPDTPRDRHDWRSPGQQRTAFVTVWDGTSSSKHSYGVKNGSSPPNRPSALELKSTSNGNKPEHRCSGASCDLKGSASDPQSRRSSTNSYPYIDADTSPYYEWRKKIEVHEV